MLVMKVSECIEGVGRMKKKCRIRVENKRSPYIHLGRNRVNICSVRNTQVLSDIEDSHGPSDAMHNPLPATQSQKDFVLKLTEIHSFLLTLSLRRDSWIWSLDISKGYTVASARRLIDSSILDVSLNATRWNQAIPIKVNVFLWRLALNKLPSRVNLDKKGIDVDSLLCPICNDDVETVNHVFFSCDMAKDLWALLARWWELDIPFCSNIFDWFTWLDSLSISHKARAFLEGVGETLLWHICNFRNRSIFSNSSPKKALL
ncbi:RNA-directed DNA polymerase, eukaryota, reverse transcriptase zinc-binding domain protein [Tanacetum coccineum]